MNGKLVGEIETRTALAGWFKIPVIFLSGSTAAVKQLQEIDPDAETTAVKEGIDNYTCISLSEEAARQLIRERAAAAMAKIDKILPYQIKGPITIEVEYTSRNVLTPDSALPAQKSSILAQCGITAKISWKHASVHDSN